MWILIIILSQFLQFSFSIQKKKKCSYGFFPSNFFREFPLIIIIFILYYLISKKKLCLPLKFLFFFFFFVNKKNYNHKSEEVAIQSKNYYRKISSLCFNDKRNQRWLHIKARVVTGPPWHGNFFKKKLSFCSLKLYTKNKLWIKK